MAYSLLLMTILKILGSHQAWCISCDFGLGGFWFESRLDHLTISWGFFSFHMFHMVVWCHDHFTSVTWCTAASKLMTLSYYNYRNICGSWLFGPSSAMFALMTESNYEIQGVPSLIAILKPFQVRKVGQEVGKCPQSVTVVVCLLCCCC